jgi:type VI secretion system protein ImpF
MPELTVSEKLQPCLLDRLSDDDPKSSVESRMQRVISVQRYRQGVLRDLGWLFSASAHLAHEGKQSFSIEDFPLAQQSVINFGTRHLFGVTSPNLRQIEKGLKEALFTFEPRIDRNTLKVRVGLQEQVISIEVEGDLWAKPMPEHLHIKTKLDIETGGCSIEV